MRSHATFALASDYPSLNMSSDSKRKSTEPPEETEQASPFQNEASPPQKDLPRMVVPQEIIGKKWKAVLDSQQHIPPIVLPRPALRRNRLYRDGGVLDCASARPV